VPEMIGSLFDGSARQCAPGFLTNVCFQSAWAGLFKVLNTQPPPGR